MFAWAAGGCVGEVVEEVDRSQRCRGERGWACSCRRGWTTSVSSAGVASRNKSRPQQSPGPSFRWSPSGRSVVSCRVVSWDVPRRGETVQSKSLSRASASSSDRRRCGGALVRAALSGGLGLQSVRGIRTARIESRVKRENVVVKMKKKDAVAKERGGGGERVVVVSVKMQRNRNAPRGAKRSGGLARFPVGFLAGITVDPTGISMKTDPWRGSDPLFLPLGGRC